MSSIISLFREPEQNSIWRMFHLRLNVTYVFYSAYNSILYMYIRIVDVIFLGSNLKVSCTHCTDQETSVEIECPDIEEPDVCGSDGKKYKNKCLFNKEKCKQRGSITKLHDGSCPGLYFVYFYCCFINRPACQNRSENQNVVHTQYIGGPKS